MLMPLAAETTFVTFELYLAIALGSVKHRGYLGRFGQTVTFDGSRAFKPVPLPLKSRVP